MTKLTKAERDALEYLFERMGLGSATITILVNLINRLIR
jgi:hypothetical protein